MSVKSTGLNDTGSKEKVRASGEKSAPVQDSKADAKASKVEAREAKVETKSGGWKPAASGEKPKPPALADSDKLESRTRLKRVKADKKNDVLDSGEKPQKRDRPSGAGAEVEQAGREMS